MMTTVQPYAKRGSCSLLKGTTKHLHGHKHNPRHTARAFIVPIVRP